IAYLVIVDLHIRIFASAETILAWTKRILKVVHLDDRHFNALGATVQERQTRRKRSSRRRRWEKQRTSAETTPSPLRLASVTHPLEERRASHRPADDISDHTVRTLRATRDGVPTRARVRDVI